MKMRSHCPINFTLEHIGDKWSLLIIRDLMFKEKRNYNQFLASEETISTSVLGDRLKFLEEGGIITKSPDANKKSRIKYSLSKKGLDLIPLLVELIVWGGFYDDKTEAHKDFLAKAKKDKPALIAELYNNLKSQHLT